MSASFLANAALRHQDSLESVPDITEPSLARLPSDIGGLVFDNLLLADLVALAEAQPELRLKIAALEERWMRGCLDATHGFANGWLDNLQDKGARLFDDDASPRGWMDAYSTLMACRDEFISGKWAQPSWSSSSGPRTAPLWGASMAQSAERSSPRCAELPWLNGETWTRTEPTQTERALREAFVQSCFDGPDLLEGAGDPQCDNFPVSLALYRRRNGTASGKPRKTGMSKEEKGTLVEGMCGLVDALTAHIKERWNARDCGYNDEPEKFVGEATSLETMLEAIGETMRVYMDHDGEHELAAANGLEMSSDKVKHEFARSSLARVTRLAGALSGLCTGSAPALSPGKTLAIVRAALKTAADDWSTEQELVPSKRVEAALVAHVTEALASQPARAEEVSRFASAVESAVAAAEVAFLASKGGGWRKVSAADAEAEGLEDLECSVCCCMEAEWRMPHNFVGPDGTVVSAECALEPRFNGNMINARRKQRVDDLVAALRAVLAELDPAAADASIVPIALSDADFMPQQLFGRCCRNDHEGKLCYACIADEWVVVVAAKVQSC